MNEYDNALSIVYAAIDEINDLLPEKQKLKKMRDTELYSSTGVLDSLGLVNFIIAVEEQIRKTYGFQFRLDDLSQMSEGDNPFSTVEALSKYIASILHENENKKKVSL